MKLSLLRETFTKESTGGILTIDNEFFCYTLEDTDRLLENTPHAKVYGKTAIPRGTYPVTIDFSPKYQRNMPHILNVPGFEGIRIHKGNYPKDTEGCILVGQKRAPDAVLESKLAFNKLYPKLIAAQNAREDIFITIA